MGIEQPSALEQQLLVRVRELETALRESEERIRAMAMNPWFVSARIDRDLRYQWIYNPHPDFDPSEVVGKRDDELDDSEGPRRLIALKRQAIEGGRTMHEEIDFQRSDGTRTYDFTVEPLWDASGTIVGAISSAFDITERKRAEEAQGRLAAIVDSAEDSIFSTDLQGVITSWNKAAARLFGYAVHETIGRPVTMLIPPGRDDEGHGILERVRSGESIQHYETVRIRKDGTSVDVSLSVSPIVDRNGQVVGTSRIARDVTERRRGQEERERLLREVEAERARLAEVFQAAPSFMCVLRGPDHVFERANELYYQLIGHREIIGKPARKTLPELEGQGFFEILDRVYQTGEAFSGTDTRVLVQRERGQPLEQLYLDFVYQPVRDAHGTVTGIFVQGVDLTRRKEAEEALRASEMQYRALFDSIDEGFCVLEMLFDDGGVAVNGRFLEVNPAFEKHTGLRDALGKTVRELVPQLDESWFKIHGDVALKGEPVRFEDFANGIDRWLDVFAFRAGEPGTRKVAALFNDITARKKVEEAKREADRRKDEFLAMLSHELRNPLAPMSNALQLLQLAHDESIEQEAVAVLQRQVGTLARLVDDLLDVSRVTTGKIQLQQADFDLNEMVQRTADAFRPLMADHRHQFTVSFSGAPLWVHGDTTRLEQVVVNLLTNAAKYTPEAGQVWLTTEKDGEHAVIRVRDNGMGMEHGLLPLVFELFTQGRRALDRRQGGLGLGLSLVKSLVEMHSGTVTAASEGPGKGSEFAVRLPLLPSAPPGQQPHSSSRSQEQQASGLRVLIVDDNLDAANMMARLLGRRGYDVQTAYDGPAAVNAALDSRPDVVLLDIGLPGMDGYEVAQRIRHEEALPGIVLVAMTGYGQAEDVRRSQEAGFDHHLIKPADFAELQRILEATRESRTT